MRKSKPVFYDRLIISRVKQYLEEHVHQTYLDVGVMTRQLQERYPEYARRKIAPFRLLVEQAYKVVSKSYGLDSNPSSDDNGSDLEVMEAAANQSSNQMNDMLTSLYSKPKPAGNSSELIDISSDDDADNDEVATTNGKNSNQKPVDKGKRDVVITPIPPNSELPQKKRRDINDIKASLPPGVTMKKRRLHDGSVSPTPKNNTTEKPANQKSGSVASDGPAPFSAPKAIRKFKKQVTFKKSHVTFSDVGGMQKILKELCELLLHAKYPEIYHVIGLPPPRGFLLHGPPGCGKTLLAQAIAGQLDQPLIEIAATELIGGVSGESEERIREVFEQAAACAPCVLFIDEIDAISSNRINAQKDMERRIVSQLISSLDALGTNENGELCLVIGATTRPEVLDPSLRRPGRFDHEIAIGIPDRKGRRDILSILCDSLAIGEGMDYDKIAELTPGYVGADLMALATRAATIAVKRACLEQRRLAEKRDRKNIPIVDLIDDTLGEAETNGNESAAKEKKDEPVSEAQESEKIGQAEKEQSEEKDKTEAVAVATEESNSVAEKPTESSEATAAINEATSSTTEMETDADESVQNKEEPQSSTTEQAEKMQEEPITSAETETIDVDELPEIDDNKYTVREPSLYQMLAWLDQSPFENMDASEVSITLDDFKAAVKLVQPAAKREGFITVPDVTWDDIGSLQKIREELQLAVLAPVKYPESLAVLGLSAPTGVLLCGPPGCGKTLLAKAIANEAGINFISVKGPELMNMYVGESERAVRTCFQRARNSAPCVIFFDEFDSLCPKRSENGEGGSGTRVVNQLLTEMDGVEGRQGVFLMAATNRPDIIDPAILRPGRLDTILYVGLPEEEDRIEILHALTKKRTRPRLADDVDLSNVASHTEGFTGADLAGLVRQSAMLALKEAVATSNLQTENLHVQEKHFIDALRLVKPSVSAEDRKVYEKLKQKYAAPRQGTVTAT